MDKLTRELQRAEEETGVNGDQAASIIVLINESLRRNPNEVKFAEHAIDVTTNFGNDVVGKHFVTITGETGSIVEMDDVAREKALNTIRGITDAAEYLNITDDDVMRIISKLETLTVPERAFYSRAAGLIRSQIENEGL